MILFGDASHNLYADARGQQCELIYGDENSAALDMSCNKEKEVTSASFESELLVMNKTVNKGILASLMLTELGAPHEHPMKLYCDNEAAVITATQEHINKMGRTKFMNRKLFYLHDKVKAGLVAPTWIESKENSADIGTKNLAGSYYDYLANRQFARMHGYDSYGKVSVVGGGSMTINNNQFSSDVVKVPDKLPKVKAPIKPSVVKASVDLSSKGESAEPELY